MRYYEEMRLLFLLMLISSPLVAQPIIVYPPTPPAGLTEEEYIAETLAGEGVQILDVTRTCFDDAFGFFRPDPNNTPIPDFGITELGVLLTSGCIENVPGPSTSGSITCGNGTPGDADLDNLLTGSTTQDACVIEFDIIPIGETLSFVYVFGSDEYPEYVCSSFNDVFAFFIDGPDPSGGTYNKTNIAIIPGTNIPVTINALNNGTGGTGGTGCDFSNSAYFVGNIPEIEYDEITDTLRAEVSVIPCETYHLKLAIADAGDSAFDSGIFLQAGSFTSPSPNLAIDGGYDVFETDENGDLVLDAAGNPIPLYTDSDGDPNGILVENCISKIIEFTVDNLDGPTTINLDIGGTAENGVDYMQVDGSPLPNEVIVTPDDPVVTFEVIAVEDGMFESLEYFVVSILGINNIDCIIDPTVSRDTVRIVDNVLPFSSATALGTGPYCPGTTVPLDAFGAETYDWFPPEFLNDPTLPNPIATITEDVTFGVALTNGPCVDTLYLEEITLYEGDAPFVTPLYGICTEDPIELFAEGASSYQWTPTTNLSCSTCPNPIYTPDGDSITYYVEMFYPSGCYYGIDSVKILYDNPAFLLGPDTLRKCTGEEPFVEFLGGTSYEWSPTTGLSNANVPNPNILIDEPMTYTITAQNDQGCEDSKQLVIEVTEVFIDAGPDITECTVIDNVQIGNVLELEGQTYAWTPTTGLSDPTVAKPLLSLENTTGTLMEMVYTLTITDDVLGCTITDDVLVSLVGNPTVDIMGEEPTIINGSGANLTVTGINNAGQYSWSPPEGLSNTNGAVVTARPSDTMKYIVEGIDEYGCKNLDSIRVNVIDPPRINIPTAFTPNGDGFQDTFRPVSKDIELQVFQIFNRWGELVYSDPNPNGWDGTYNGNKQDIGVYVYYIQYQFINGDEVEQIQGEVTLIR